MRELFILRGNPPKKKAKAKANAHQARALTETVRKLESLERQRGRYPGGHQAWVAARDRLMAKRDRIEPRLSEDEAHLATRRGERAAGVGRKRRNPKKSTTTRKRGTMAKKKKGKGPSKAKRRAAAKKAARTRAAKKAARSRAAKKAARSRKASKRRPAAKKKRSTSKKRKAGRRPAKRRASAKRSSKRRSGSKRRAGRRGVRVSKRVGRTRLRVELSNPGRGLGGKLRSLLSKDTLMTTGQGVAGFALALALPRLALQAAGKSHLNRGWKGVAVSAIASVLASAAVGSLLRSQKAAGAVLTGGLVASGVRAALLVLPASQADKVLPVRDLGTLAAAPAPSASGVRALSGMGSYSPLGALAMRESAARMSMPIAAGGMGAFFSPGRSLPYAPANHTAERF